MSMPISSPGSDETEGSILREFVDENIAQEQRAYSPRSELLSQTSRRRDKIATTQGQHVSRRRRSRRHRSGRELAHPEASPDELVTLLVEQEHESRRLRRALLTAADRIDVESRRTAEMERANTDVAQRFRILNDSRLAAQQDALKASQELRLYHFQLQAAQTEITRGQEMLRVVQAQRDEAEESAIRARQKARQLHQERIIAAAKEEGRKYGFEAGLQRAQEEYRLAVRQTHQRRNPKSGRRKTEGTEQTYPQLEVEATHIVQQPNINREVVQDNDDQLSQVSSPSRLPLHNLSQAHSPEVIRVVDPPMPEPIPAPEPLVYPSLLEMRRSSPPPPEPVPIVQPTPDVPRAYSPSMASVQLYPVEIPPASEIEQRFGPNEFPRKSSQPWVTAREHLELTQQQQQQMLQEQFEGMVEPDADLPRGMPQSATESGSKRKETWYQTLRRKTFGRRKRPEAPNSAMTAPPVSQSWYIPKPPVHIRDFAVATPVPRPRSSVDSGSASTRVSQLDIVSTPNPNGSTSGRSGPARRFKQNLHVISEDPMSREATPIKENPGHRKSKSLDPQGVGSPPYSNPNAVDEWRKSNAGSLKTTSVTPPGRPPTYIRRPAKLTMPGPLAPSAGMSGSSRERTMSDTTGVSTPRRLRRINKSNLHVVNVDEPEISPGIGITVQPPSRSPTDAVPTPSSYRQGSGYLSPNHAQQSLPPQDLRSAPSFSSMSRQSANESAPRDPSDHGQSHTPPNEYASASQYQGNSRPNSPHTSIRNQLSPSSNDWFARPLSRISQPLPSDQPVPSRAQSRDGGNSPHMSIVGLTPGSVKNQPLPPTSDNGDLGLSHVASMASMRSGSYARYDPATYLDPAYYPPNATAADYTNPPDATRARSAASPTPRSRTHSKAASNASSLEYV